jgi:putative SOS response-associated peptidase YedK
MCGRIALTASIEQIKQHFGLLQGSAVLVPRYNIAPGQVVLVINNNQLEFYSWGVKLTTAVNNNRNIIINARLETVTEKRSFKVAFAKQRCLVVASGFFEWRPVNGKKIPYYITVQNQPILGLAAIIVGGNCVILTTAANSATEFSAIHNRAPVIINQENYALWLSSKTSVDKLLDPNLLIQQNNLQMFPVSMQVNNPKFDQSACIKSVT